MAMAMLTETFRTTNIELFKSKALHWASSFKTACCFDSNYFHDPYSSFDTLIAAGASHEISSSHLNSFEDLQKFLESHSDWILGFLSYDLKNQIENLQSKNCDLLQFPELYFAVPEHLILIKDETVTIRSSIPKDVYHSIENASLETVRTVINAEIKSRITKDEYIQSVQALQDHIHRGDIYEVNFCQEFYAENISLNPIQSFKELNRISPTPFANFFKLDQHYIISATPERFLSRKGKKLISQPIKGTAKRSTNVTEDDFIKKRLRNDPKEQAENVMIVDLVRNDLSRCAVDGTVSVEELFGIYSFKQVHQMISTVVCEANPLLGNIDILKKTFPMGSMTGAPKIKAMELIEQYEMTKRGIFSGAVGYFAPNGDFDFNVVIRSLLYNASNKYISFQVGSAITFESDAEKEYEECLLKAEAIRELLNSPR
jgi:para-aminobenzoate synthetase component 1